MIDQWTMRIFPVIGNMGFSIHGGTPSSHPFGIFPNKNHPAIGVLPWRAGNLQLLVLVAGHLPAVVGWFSLTKTVHVNRALHGFPLWTIHFGIPPWLWKPPYPPAMFFSERLYGLVRRREVRLGARAPSRATRCSWVKMSQGDFVVSQCEIRDKWVI